MVAPVELPRSDIICLSRYRARPCWSRHPSGLLLGTRMAQAGRHHPERIAADRGGRREADRRTLSDRGGAARSSRRRTPLCDAEQIALIARRGPNDAQRTAAGFDMVAERRRHASQWRAVTCATGRLSPSEILCCKRASGSRRSSHYCQKTPAFSRRIEGKGETTCYRRGRCL